MLTHRSPSVAMPNKNENIYFFFSGVNSSLLRFIFARDGSPWSSTQIKEAIPNGRITPHAKSYTSNVCGQIIIMFLARLYPNIAESFLGEALCSRSIYGSLCVCVSTCACISRLYGTGKKENRVAGRPGQKQKIHSLSTHTHTH
jgi:hypothetical protein